eukprot:Hpha_TRINITY_DN15626_c1_g1::TRINITY_DN15626_c1_g1_i1::g.100189::m.100189
MSVVPVELAARVAHGGVTPVRAHAPHGGALPPPRTASAVYAVTADPEHSRIAADLAALDMHQKKALDDATSTLVGLVTAEQEAGAAAAEKNKHTARTSEKLKEAETRHSESAVVAAKARQEAAERAAVSAGAEEELAKRGAADTAARVTREQTQAAAEAANANLEVANKNVSVAADAAAEADAKVAKARSEVEERRTDLRVLTDRCLLRLRDEVAGCQREEEAAAVEVERCAAPALVLPASEERVRTAETRLRNAQEKLSSAQGARITAVSQTTQAGQELLRAREAVEMRRQDSQAAMVRTETALLHERLHEKDSAPAPALGRYVVDAHRALSEAQCVFSEAAALHAAAEASAAEAAVMERRWQLDLTLAERELADALVNREAAAVASTGDTQRREAYAQARMRTQDMLRRLDALEAEAAIARKAVEAAERAVDNPAAAASESAFRLAEAQAARALAAGQADRCASEAQAAAQAEAATSLAVKEADRAAATARAAAEIAEKAAIEKTASERQACDAMRQAQSDAASALSSSREAQEAFERSQRATKAQAEAHAGQRSENLALEARRAAHAMSPQRVHILPPPQVLPPPASPHRVVTTYVAPPPPVVYHTRSPESVAQSSLGYTSTPPTRSPTRAGCYGVRI